MGKPTFFDRIKVWLSQLLGSHYAAAISIVDRAAVVFATTFVARLVGSGLDLHNLVSVSYLQTCAVAAIGAVVVLIQGVITTGITGSPAPASLVSRTVRARRDNGYRVQHDVPLRPSKRKATR